MANIFFLSPGPLLLHRSSRSHSHSSPFHGFPGYPRLPNSRLTCSSALSSRFPSAAAEIVDPKALALLSRVEFTPVRVPELPPEAIETAHICSAGKLGGWGGRERGEGHGVEIRRGGRSEREVVVLLHGFDSSLLEFRALVPEMEREGEGRVEVRCVDLLGWGFTEKPRGIAYGVRAKRAHLRGYLEQVVGLADGARLTLVGCSLGGAVAVDLAVECRGLVDRVVLVDAEVVRERKAGSKFASEGFLPRSGVRLLKSWVLRRVAIEGAFWDKKFKTAENVKIGRLHCFTEGWEEATLAFLKEDGYAVKERLQELQAKDTLVIWGRNDNIIGRQTVDVIETKIRGCRVKWIEECGHIPHLERPTEVARYILDFVLSPHKPPSNEECDLIATSGKACDQHTSSPF